MLDAPERVEIHGSDRAWRAGVLAAVMATAGMSFGPARADSDPAYLSHIDAPSASFFARKAVVPNTDAAAGEVMRRAGAQEIASTAVSVRPTVYPFAFPAGMNEDQVQDKVMQFVFSGRVMEPALGGAIRLQNNLVADVPKTETPISWSYVAKERGRTGCAFLISDQHAPAIASLARTTGLSTEAALDFAVMHESAHCVQQAETLTAAYDVMRYGRVLPERVASGMLGAQAEQAIAEGRDSEVFMSGFLSGRSNKLSAERFADAFAMLALMAQNRITGQQIEGLIAWRLGDAATHNTASFSLSCATRCAGILPRLPRCRPSPGRVSMRRRSPHFFVLSGRPLRRRRSPRAARGQRRSQGSARVRDEGAQWRSRSNRFPVCGRPRPLCFPIQLEVPKWQPRTAFQLQSAPSSRRCSLNPKSSKCTATTRRGRPAWSASSWPPRRCRSRRPPMLTVPAFSSGR
ncbi:hypothetical protein QZH52_29190 [Variovorax ginsengisoli]|uniref:Uncharacterized protein n=2 Tax=Variovorax ginsengisoli TaxID=363844 RepID=A0ABT8SBS9_9BURK|nr:hypothetical protein [Variovorax ginsengisoli]MDO1536368.1 hypothetical protein [Variovorax ginsengisoli]